MPDSILDSVQRKTGKLDAKTASEVAQRLIDEGGDALQGGPDVHAVRDYRDTIVANNMSRKC